MAKTQISIKLDSDLLERIDKLAEDVGITRTAIIEQAVQNDLPEQESFHKSLENPLMRGIHETLSSPKVLRLLARLSNGEITDEEIANIMQNAPRQRDAARARAATKKQPKRNTGLEGAS